MTAGFRIELSSSASPAAIYDLLADADHWQDWVPVISRSELVRSGTEDRLGAGAVRRLVAVGLVPAEEQILEARRPDYQRYTLLAGMPVSDYDGQVRLQETADGTALTWTGVFRPRIPGTGWVLAKFLGMSVRFVATRAIAAAEKAQTPG